MGGPRARVIEPSWSVAPSRSAWPLPLFGSAPFVSLLRRLRGGPNPGSTVNDRKCRDAPTFFRPILALTADGAAWRAGQACSPRRAPFVPHLPRSRSEPGFFSLFNPLAEGPRIGRRRPTLGRRRATVWPRPGEIGRPGGPRPGRRRRCLAPARPLPAGAAAPAGFDQSLTMTKTQEKIAFCINPVRPSTPVVAAVASRRGQSPPEPPPRAEFGAEPGCAHGGGGAHRIVRRRSSAPAQPGGWAGSAPLKDSV